MKKLLLALCIIREITLTQKITKKRITKYYLNFYNPIVWTIFVWCVIKYSTKELYNTFKDIYKYSINEAYNEYFDFKQYEKCKKENGK